MCSSIAAALFGGHLEQIRRVPASFFLKDDYMKACVFAVGDRGPAGQDTSTEFSHRRQQPIYTEILTFEVVTSTLRRFVSTKTGMVSLGKYFN